MTPGDVIRGCFDTFAACLPPGDYDGADHVAWAIISSVACGDFSLRSGLDEAAALDRLELLLALSSLCSGPIRECLQDMIEHRLDELTKLNNLRAWGLPPQWAEFDTANIGAWLWDATAWAADLDLEPGLAVAA